MNYGNWTFIKDLGFRVVGNYKINGKVQPYQQRFYKMKCSCGRIVEGAANRFDNARSKMCKACTKTTHNQSRTSEYWAWVNMKRRCYYEKYRKFKDYGGRGITVCKRWLNSFENFIADMGKKPTAKHTLDRINVNGNYEPGNCRWATWKQQGTNKRKLNKRSIK